MFNSEVWKYIVQRKILFSIVVVITVLTPIAYKAIDSYTRVVIARMDRQQPSNTPEYTEKNIKTNNISIAGRINTDNKKIQIARTAK